MSDLPPPPPGYTLDQPPLPPGYKLDQPAPVNTNAVALGGADMDEYFSQGSAGAILDAFGQGAKDGWGTRPLGLDPEADKWLQKNAPDYGVLGRAFHDQIVRPAAAGIDALFRAPAAVIRGVSEPLVRGGVPPELTPEGLFEAFPLGHATGLPARIPMIDRAADLGVIGKGEASWKGLPEAVEALTPNREVVARPVSREPFGPAQHLEDRPAEVAPVLDAIDAARPPSPPPPTLISAVRVGGEIYTGLTHGDAYAEALRAHGGIEPPGTTAADRNLFVTADGKVLSHSEAVALRETAFSPDAPNAAAERLRRIDELTNDRLAAERGDIANGSPVRSFSAIAEGEGIPGGIAGDVSRQLVEAGRPTEEANAAAALIQSHYEARAERFGGALGSAEDLYRAEAPEVRAGRGVRQQSEMEMAQQQGPGRAGKIRLATDDARATITLLKNADASTFIHETGHHWLEELVRDSTHEQAPADLTADAQAVRGWLGVKEGETIPTKAHEKFARGFERYMMEGRAPSTKLAAVFAKFKDWLTNIYETVSRLRSPINDNIRGVFDRLVADRNATRPEVAPATLASRGVYETVPPEPRRLVDFLRREGGLQDQGGEISHIIGGKNQRPGLINGKGKSLDDAALRAWEEGYFPEHGTNRPTINDLLDAIAEDSKGNARYSFKDEAMANAFRGAMDRNAEIDQLGEQMGVNPRDYSREEFFDMVAEHLSQEEQARQISSLSEASESAFDEAERKAKEWTESQGDSWEPDAIYGTSEARSLEDLENAYEQEAEVAGNAGESPRGSGAPGSAAAGQRSLQVSSGQSGRGAGATGRAGAGAGEPPRGPTASFGPTDQRLIDKAGNIRIDNLNVPADVAQAIRQAAEENGGFIAARRGVISDGEVLQLADALGMDPASLSRRKLGEAFNAEQVVAARQLLIRSATEVRDAMAKAASGTDADVVSYGVAKARHLMIQEQVSGLTAEAGRALRAFRAIEGSKDATALGEFLQQNTGRTLNQMRREAQLGLKLDTPQQISKFVKDSEKPTWKDYIIEAWINALLSGPLTHIKNIIGNSAVAVNSVIETAGAAAVGKALGSTERVRFREVEARIFGLVEGAKDGIIAAGKALADEGSTQFEAHTLEQKRFQAIPSVKVNVGGIDMELGGKQIRLPGRFLTAEDEFFKAVAARQELKALAYRKAANEGLTGDAFNARVAALVENPTDAEVAASRKNAEYQTFTNPLGPMGRAVQQFANGHILAKVVIPFIRTPVNIAKYANERTPFGLLSREVRDNLRGRNGEVARDTQIARMALGTMVATATAGLVAQGLITGAGPSDPKQKAALRLTGWQPYSLKIGGMYYSYAWLDPLGTIVGVTADLTDAAKAGTADDADLEKVAAMVVGSASKNIMGKLSLRGTSDFIQTLTDPDRYGPKWLQSLAGTVVPSVVAQVARAEDPVMRDARTVMDTIKSRIPGLRETVMPRRDLWGEPIPNQGALGPDLLSPIVQSRINADPVNRALVDLKFSPAPPEHKIRGVELTPKQYDDYSRISGRMAKMELDAIVPALRGAPPDQQIKTISGIVSNWRETTATQIMIESMGTANDIMKKSTDAKAALLGGATREHAKQMMKAP